jgi:hypothetical protein
MWHDEFNSYDIKQRYTVRAIHSVKNRLGCEQIKGLWDKTHGVCILHEFIAGSGHADGWTAPVRGAFFYWYVGPVFDERGERFGGAIGAQRIETDPEYPDHPLLLPNVDSGIFYKESHMGKHESVDDFYQRIKKSALVAASDTLLGKASEHDMIYYNEKGETYCVAESIRDDVGYPPCGGCCPCPTDMHKREPFKYRRGGP